MQRLVTQQAVAMADGKEVHVGPVTLRPRFNNVATKAPEIPAVRDLSSGYGAQWFGSDDQRQQSPELAAWTIASAAAIGVAGVNSITYFEQQGPRGIQSAEGDPFPVSLAVSALAQLVGGNLLTGESPDGLLWATGAISEFGVKIMAANLREQPAEIEIYIEVLDKTITALLPALSWQSLTI
jgi:hypothetical protein